MTAPASQSFLASFDLETTGTDPETARIVSAAIVIVDPGGVVAHADEWLIDPGIEIPAEATAVHGITTEQVREYGIPTAQAITNILGELYSWHTGDDDDRPHEPYPLVVFNAPYDLTVLDRETRRAYGHGLLEHISEAEGELVREDWLGPVFDPLVIDKHIDRYRPGLRRLTAQCEHHGVPFDGEAHGARADALAAARLMQTMILPADQSPDGRPWPVLDMTTADALHAAQIRWKREQAEGFADYLRTNGNPERADAVSPAWPMIDHPEAIPA